MADEVPISGPSRERDGRVEVLVLDDEPAVRWFAARVLLDEGYAVHEASDGAGALALVRSRPLELDLVLSDVVMPVLNGVELLQALSVGHPDLPVLLMSGYGVGELSAKGIAPPCGILPKPFPREQLLEEVRRCIRTRN